MTPTNNQLTNKLQEALTSLNNAYSFYSKSSAWSIISETTHTFLNCADNCRKLSLEVLYLLLKQDINAPFDSDGTLYGDLKMSWTDIKQSLNIESNEDLVKEAMLKNEQLQTQFLKLISLTGEDQTKEILQGHIEMLEHQAINIRNL